VRAGIGLGRMGGGLSNGSGDIFFAFATGNRGIPRAGLSAPPATVPLQVVTNDYMTPLFHAAAEATEEAILNALLAAGDMTGRDGITARGLTPELLRLRACGRGRCLFERRLLRDLPGSQISATRSPSPRSASGSKPPGRGAASLSSPHC
jgi:hypothetical protein